MKEKTSMIQRKSLSDPAQSCRQMQNKADACQPIDARLTRACSRTVRRQLLTLSKVHGQSSDYYRAALMPVIRAAVARLEARS